MIIIPYADLTEREVIITTKQNEGYVLSEEQNIKNGNFLIFNKTKTPTTEERIAVLEAATNFLLGLEVV